MPQFVFKGMAVVTGVEIIVSAETLGEAIGAAAQQNNVNVDLDVGDVDYFWADLNSGRERRKRKANGAGEPPQVEAAPAHDPAEPPLPLDANDSADIPPFLRR